MASKTLSVSSLASTAFASATFPRPCRPPRPPPPPPRPAPSRGAPHPRLPPLHRRRRHRPGRRRRRHRRAAAPPSPRLLPGRPRLDRPPHEAPAPRGRRRRRPLGRGRAAEVVPLPGRVPVRGGRGGVQPRGGGGAGAAHPRGSAGPDPARRRQPELRRVPRRGGAHRLRERLRGVPLRRRARRAVRARHLLRQQQKVQRYRDNRHVSMGAEKWLDIELWNSTVECFSALKKRGYRIATTCLGTDSVSVYDMDWSQPTAIVVGNELRGISDDTLKLSDLHCSVPMKVMVDSFNVSVAAGILMHHAVCDRVSRLGNHGNLLPEESRILLAEFYLRHRESTGSIVNEYAKRKAENFEDSLMATVHSIGNQAQ